MGALAAEGAIAQPPPLVNRLIPPLALGLAYFLCAYAGLQWATVAGAASPVWPAAGVGLAGLALVGPRFWPILSLALFAAMQAAEAAHGLSSQVMMAIGNGAASALGAWLLRRGTSDGRPGLRRLRDFTLFLFGGCTAAATSASVGTLALLISGNLVANAPVAVFSTWFLGDAVGIFIFGALILSLAQSQDDNWGADEWTHLLVVLAVAAMVSWVVFFGPRRAVAFYLYPVLVWAGFYMRTLGASAMLTVAATVAVAGTSLGHGPFADDSGGDLLLLQQFLAVAALMALLLGAVSDERHSQLGRDARRARLLADSRLAELTSLYDSAPIGLGFFDRNYRYLRINDELALINGVAPDAHIGKSIREIIPVNAPAVEPVIDRIFETGEAVRDLEVSGETPSHPGVLRHWLTGFYPVHNEAGGVEAVGAWVIEISERKAAQERETLLAREVDHRAKNLLTVVQSVMQLTRADSVEELKASVIGRIQSLARAHALLASSRWEGVELSQLVAEELAPFGGGKTSQVTYAGPKTTLWPAAAQSVALVLHELATNAAKYGALSTLDGRVEISWDVSGDPPQLVLDWVEHATVPVAEPANVGFGSRIISASVERQLQGRVTHEWRPEGLHCRLEFQLRSPSPTAVP